MKLLERKGEKSELGFTLIELMVVIAILSLFYGFVVANYGKWRGPQYVKFGAAELATNLNKIRAYSLSARNYTDENQIVHPAMLYTMEFCTDSASSLCASAGSPAYYRLHIVYSDATGVPIFDKRDLELFNLPGTAYVKSISVTDYEGNVTTPSCAQVAFSLPYGRTYVDPACRLDDNIATNPFKSLPALDQLANASAVITLAWPGGSQEKVIRIDGVTGRVGIE